MNRPEVRALLTNRRPLLSRVMRWAGEGPPIELGVVTARSDAPSAEELAALQRFCTFVEVVNDYDAAEVEDLILELCKRHEINRLLFTAETDVLRCARVRQQLGIPGQSVASAEAYRSKYAMKRQAAEAGVATARMALLTDGPELTGFLAETTFPVLLKPLRGAASIGIIRAGNKEGFAIARAVIAADEEYVAEEFVEGDMYHVDGLMRCGQVLRAWPSRYLYPQLSTMCESRPNISGMLSADDPITTVLLKATRRVIGGLAAADDLLPFHAEFILTSDGTPVLCEIACRAGGAGIAEAYELSFGTGMYEATIKSQLDIPVELGPDTPQARYGWAWFPPERGRLVSAPDRCELEGVQRYLLKGRIGQTYTGPSAVTTAIAQIVFALDDAEDVTAQLERFEQWWSRRCEYA